MKKVISLLLVLALALSLVACASAAPAAEATEAPAEAAATEAPAAEATGEGITLGVISPNTGALAVYGAAVTTAVDLAVSEINAAGGINGQQIEILTFDNKMSPQETAIQAQKAIEAGSPPCSPQMPILIPARVERPRSAAILTSSPTPSRSMVANGSFS